MKRSDLTINQPLERVTAAGAKGEKSALTGTDKLNALTTFLDARELLKMKNLIARFIRDDQGQDLIEYALLGSFVSLAAYTGATLLGTAYNSWFGAVATEVNGASTKVAAMIP